MLVHHFPLVLSQLLRTKLTGHRAVDGSPKCGACFKLQYDHKEPIYIIAVDNAAMFQLSKAGFEKFAGAEGFAKGSVDATAVEVSPEFCRLSKKW